jgi:hypothetical protein
MTEFNKVCLKCVNECKQFEHVKLIFCNNFETKEPKPKKAASAKK